MAWTMDCAALIDHGHQPSNIKAKCWLCKVNHESVAALRALGRVSRVRRQSVHPSVRRGIPPSFARANEKIIIKQARRLLF
jgi:hypothetical protein